MKHQKPQRTTLFIHYLKEIKHYSWYRWCNQVCLNVALKARATAQYCRCKIIMAALCIIGTFFRRNSLRVTLFDQQQLSDNSILHGKLTHSSCENILLFIFCPLQLLSRLQRTLFRLPFKEWRHVGRHRAETTRRHSLPRPQSVGMRGERGQAAGQEETLHRFSSLPRLHDWRGHRWEAPRKEMNEKRKQLEWWPNLLCAFSTI